MILVALAAAAIAAVPTSRHFMSALWNSPDFLPASPADKQVHYQPGAEEHAREVAALLPEAIARVEAVQGRRFAHLVTVGVYATPEAYAAANGLGTPAPVGVTFLGRVNLSPKLFSTERKRLPAILTHELSHAHLQSWIGLPAYIGLPNWFKEGLAVMVSDGGGAESVNEREAQAAIQRGERITIDDAGSVLNLVAVNFERPPAPASASAYSAMTYPQALAYREAGMFVTYLRDSDGPAFASMMRAILDGSPFAEAVNVGYHKDTQSLWSEFIQMNADRTP